ncbi:MAG: flagellar basal body rod protein FlgC [Gemmatimonas sp.]|nr:flagellar basal body rod protein FlgC [Gemmatimonas sp.]
MTSPIGSLEPQPTERRLFKTLGIAASGLTAQRLRMDTIALNLANAETTRTEAGGPYRRRVVEMEAGDAPGSGVQVTGIAEDPSEGPVVYEPGHPDANADGYVRYPNVRITDEMMDLMDARHLFEANVTVFQAAKAMLRRAIDI